QLVRRWLFHWQRDPAQALIPPHYRSFPCSAWERAIHTVSSVRLGCLRSLLVPHRRIANALCNAICRKVPATLNCHIAANLLSYRLPIIASVEQTTSCHSQDD